MILPNCGALPLGGAVPVGEAIPEGGTVPVGEGDGRGTVTEGGGGGGAVAPPRINGGDVGPLTAAASRRPCFMGRSADCVWITVDLWWY